MQNFTTILHADLVNKKRIFLPAGKTKFTIVDVSYIVEVTAKIITEISNHVDKAYELTNKEKLTFLEMASIIDKVKTFLQASGDIPKFSEITSDWPSSGR